MGIRTTSFGCMDNCPKEGLNYLRAEVNDYWGQRKKIAEILRYLHRLHHLDHMPHWGVDAKAADTLAGAIDNDFA